MFGYIKSKYDQRDYAYANYMSAIDLPERFELPETPLVDQGPRGTCVATAYVNIRDYQEQSDTRAKLSREFAYKRSKATDGMPDAEGTTPRACLEIGLKEGTCKEGSFPYNSAGEITPEMMQEASGFKIKSYVKINTIEELKNALYAKNAPIFAGLLVSKKFRNGTAEENGNHFAWHPFEQILGGHMINIVGYDDNMTHQYIDPSTFPDSKPKYTGFVKIKNSWANWGNANGYAWMPYAWIESKIHCDEMYTMIDIVTEGVVKVFVDVESWRWSKEAIDWAANSGLMSGYPDGTFKPAEPLTREQMAQILYNMHKKGVI